MPRVWKISTTIPVPKKTIHLQLNDYHPITLTPIIAKYLVKAVSKHLKFDVVDQLDPFRVAYKASSCFEDAILITLLNLITQHLEKLSHVSESYLLFFLVCLIQSNRMCY